MPVLPLWLSVLTIAVSMAGPCFVPAAAHAQSAACSGQTEQQLRERALNSNDPEQSRTYLSCFSYGDGANSVRAHDKKLQEDLACRKAMTSTNAEELRAFITQWSQSDCAPRIAQKLSEINDLSAFRHYPGSVFAGTILRKGTIGDEKACAFSCKSSGASCVGYSFESTRSACVLWSRIDSRSPRGNTVSGSLAEVNMQGPQAPAIVPLPDRMQQLADMDLPGRDYLNLPNVTLDQCDSYCSQSAECLAYTYNSGARVCFLKEWAGAPVPFGGAISGFKSSMNPMSAPRRPMQILYSVDLPNAANPAEDYALIRPTTFPTCKAGCEADGQCAAFTYNQPAQACILKRSYGRRVQFYGAISGVK